MRQNLSLWEKALTDVLNQTVKFDESDVFLAEIEQQLVNFHYQDSVLVIYACVGQLLDERQAISLLQANCFWQGTKGGTLSMLDDETIILASQCLIQNKAALSQRLTDFLTALSYWSAQLAQNNKQVSNPLGSNSGSKRACSNKAESKRWLSLDLL